jgi:spermidine/putrescine transport system permease protein
VGAVQASIEPHTHAATQRKWRPSLIVVIFSVAWAWLVLGPVILTLIYSFLRQGELGIEWHFSWAGWAGLVQYGRDETIVRTFRIALICTAIEFLVAFPAAYWVAKRLRNKVAMITILVLLTAPFFLGEDSRTVVWQSVYNRNGLLNVALQHLGVIDQPISSLLFSELSIYLGLLPLYFGSMFFPIWLAMTLIDDEYIEASRDLGGSYFDLVKDILVPLAAPGIIAGFIFTLVPMLGDTVVSSLLGGGQVVLISDTVNSLVTNFQYSVTAAISVVMTGVVAILLLVLLRSRALRHGFVDLRR